MRKPVANATVCAVSLMLLAGNARATEATFAAHDLLRLQVVSAVEISPDGSHLAYLLNKPRDPFTDEDGSAYAELYVADRRGASQPFVTGKVTVQELAWRADRPEISFLAKRSGDEETSLYVIPVTGGESRKVLGLGASITGYSWSPDGQQVAVLATEAESQERMKWKERGFEPEVYEESARPIRVWIAPVESDAGASKPRMLDLPGSASDIRWSPAGNQLAVALAPTSLVDDSFMHRVVHLVAVESGEVLVTLEHEAKLGRFGWSPDGRHLFTIAGEDINDPREGRLYLWSSEGEWIRELVPDYAGHVGSAAWIDNNTVAFVGQEGVETTLAEISVNDATRQTLLPRGQIIADSLSVSGNGHIAFIGQTARHPREMFTLDRNTPKRLTTSNPWLNKLPVASQEVIRYKARDGLDLEGVLIRPFGHERGRRYPLILVVHGGPEAHFSNGWLTSHSTLGQIAAARGFALFYPNYRGSTGRGVEFSKAGQGDPAGREFDDLVDAVDHLVGIGLVDKDRVGITGHSYGGYASAWGATYYSERFAASVTSAGESNWLSAFGTTDIPYEMYHVHFRKMVSEYPAFFFERSPVAHASRHRTPLLILHGMDDPRIHPSQSLELYRYLKLQGQAPVRLILYPGEGHTYGKATTQLDYALRLLEWMEHYLQGPGGDPPPFELKYGMGE